MVSLVADEAILALGIVGPISPDPDVISTVLNDTLNRGDLRYTQRDWSLAEHSHQTLALSYRYSRYSSRDNDDCDGGRLCRHDKLQAVEFVMTYCERKGLEQIYIWLDRSFSENRKDHDTAWAAGGIAPYAVFPVVSVISRREPRLADSYGRFWIYMETVLGAMGRGVWMRQSNRHESHQLDNLFEEVERRGGAASTMGSLHEGLGFDVEVIYKGLIVSLCQNLLDANPLYRHLDREEMKDWACKIRNENVEEYLHWQRNTKVASVISLFGAHPWSCPENDSDGSTKCWDVERDFEFHAPPELLEGIREGVAIVCRLGNRYHYAVCIPRSMNGMLASSGLSVLIEGYGEDRTRHGEAVWVRRLVCHWQHEAVNDILRIVHENTDIMRIPNKDTEMELLEALTVLHPRHERGEAMQRLCDIVDQCQVLDLDLCG